MSIVQLANQLPPQLRRPNLAAPPPRGNDPLSMKVESSDEERVAEIVGRLRRRYPDQQISRAALEERVCAVYREFAAAHVRTYVAVFVERIVRRSIDKA